MNALARVAVILVTLAPTAAAAAELTAVEAERHVGENATVCGVVASAHYAPQSRGQPTFLNFDQPYPHAAFTALIWGEDLAKFGGLEQLEGKRICVSGMISMYRSAPEIVLHDPQQLQPQ